MDVAIIGGGIVGTTLAAALGETDMETILLEKGNLGRGTTATSAAVFTWQQSSPNSYDHKLRERSWETYQPLIKAGDLTYERVGMLTLATSAERANQLQSTARTLRKYNIDAEWVDAKDLREYDLDLGDMEGGLYTPEEGYFDTDNLVTTMADGARERDVNIRTGVTVNNVLVEDGTVSGIRTDDGDNMDVDVVINAAGPWASQINAMVSIEAPLRHTFGPIIVVEGEDHNLPFTLFESKYYFRPINGDRTYVGRYATAYDEGVRFNPDDPPAIHNEVQDEMHSLLDASVPALANSTVVDEWVGLRTVTPDGRPIVGETNVSGFYLAVGMSGLGITLAPAVANLLARELTGEHPSALTPLSPDRFS